MDILVVDNSKLYAQILESNLDPGKNSIHYYKSPDIAFTSAKQHHFDYICVSYFLEQTDGINFAGQIRAIEGYANVPIILFASKQEVAISKQALASGITDIFYKEDDFQELVAHILRFGQRKNKINAKVLLVEDSISQQQLIQSILEEAGLQVSAFEDGSIAFESFVQENYELVVTDILLEGHVSGVKLLNMIRRLNNDKGDVPILAMTAFDSLSRRVDMFSRGVSDYIQKPLIKEEFIARVTNLINNQRLLKLLREQRKTIEEASEEELSVMASAFENNEAILIADAFAHIIRTNKSFLDISGFDEEEVIGKNLWSYCFVNDDNESVQPVIENIQKALLEKDNIWHAKAKNKRKNGELYDIEIKISATRNYDQEIRHFMVVFSDLSEQIETGGISFQQEYFDEVTLLANRKKLMNELESEFIKAQARQTYGAVLFIHLSCSRINNETKVQSINDRLVIEAAQRLKDKFSSKVTIAKIEKLKFVILLPDLCGNKNALSGKARNLAEQIKALLSETYVLDQQPLHLDVHIGVSLFPNGQKSIHDIINQAELANFSALSHKTSSVFFFSESMQELANHTACIEQNLEHALGNNELNLLLQPQYDACSNIIGAEALLYWEHEGKLIPSELFIQVVEQKQKIDDFSQWILQKIVETIDLWQQSNIICSAFKIAINVSSIQYLQDSFLLYIKQLSDQYPQALKHIQLELTESVFSENIESNIDKMKQLQELDINIALDNFGKGFFSLEYLSKLPIDILKIDKSFVHDIHVEKENEVIVETVISMAHHMQMSVIAEGIETRRQFLFLRAKKCDFFQGYLFSKPLPIHQFEKLLSEQPQLNTIFL